MPVVNLIAAILIVVCYGFSIFLRVKDRLPTLETTLSGAAMGIIVMFVLVMLCGNITI